MRKNRYVRFGFGGATVLVACHGHQVSFNTTEDGQTVNYQLIWLEASQVSHLH